jgi:hypothetical protein
MAPHEATRTGSREKERQPRGDVLANARQRFAVTAAGGEETKDAMKCAQIPELAHLRILPNDKHRPRVTQVSHLAAQAVACAPGSSSPIDLVTHSAEQA